MPKLSLSVRLASGSLLVLSLLHIVVWTYAALLASVNAATSFPEKYLLPIAALFAFAGVPGIVVAVGLFRSKNWARIAAMVIAALVGTFCAFAIMTIAVALLNPSLIPELFPNRSDLATMLLVYGIVLALAVWWIILFSRRNVAAQFTSSLNSSELTQPHKPSCPPPIALLAWLMIGSSALCAISWPLILGRIPAMLFTHIFSPSSSKWIWIANILAFTICGTGLLKLQRWSYNATIALHLFWLASLFVTQLSPAYDRYLDSCITTLDLPQSYSALSRFQLYPWISATLTAIPTLLLIIGLLYYRRLFLRAAAEASSRFR